MLQRVQELGADATVNLATSKDLVASYREAARGDIHVIVDYVWGPATEAALQAASVGGRLIQVGTPALQEIRLSALLLRGKFLTVLGYAGNHASFERRATAYRHITELAGQGRLTIPVEHRPLRQVEQAWERQHSGTRQRLVLIP